LGVEVGRFEPEFTDASYGYSISATQTIRTQGYMDALQSNTLAQTELSKAQIKNARATYIKTLEDLYTDYVYQSKLLGILQEEHRLSLKMANTVKERYQNGSESKVAYLQAKTQTLALKTQIHSTKKQKQTLYYQLLAMGGFSKKISLSKKFIYPVPEKYKQSKKQSAKEKILLAKHRLFTSQLRMKENHFESYNITAGIEKEPEQSILRLGISLTLPLRHNKEEEKALARIKMQTAELDRGQLHLDIRSKKQMYKSALKELSSQYHALTLLKKEQLSLTKLLQEGYTIAQGRLLELMIAKNALIQTKKSLLLSQKELNLTRISLRLLQGHYDD